ncbi:hypothetical protein [Catenulispora subtropica]|uniref:Uncharacterized protein n=1 Tax=Catenulispora subtropica TaxID=450798 RepID=A0ABP5EJ41_9ACTN
MPEQPEFPARAEVLRRWRDVVAGATSREDGHRWAAPWVEGVASSPEDVMVLTGLQYLHGFDLVLEANGGYGHSASGAEGPYIKPPEEVEADLDHWLRQSALYDEDPPGYVARKIAAAQEALKRER